MKTYTVWICEANGEGTHHVSSHKARSPDGAAKQALAETAHDWEFKQRDLRVLGIAEGNVNLIEWNDSEWDR